MCTDARQIVITIAHLELLKNNLVHCTLDHRKKHAYQVWNRSIDQSINQSINQSNLRYNRQCFMSNILALHGFKEKKFHVLTIIYNDPLGGTNLDQRAII